MTDCMFSEKTTHLIKNQQRKLFNRMIGAKCYFVLGNMEHLAPEKLNKKINKICHLFYLYKFCKRFKNQV